MRGKALIAFTAVWMVLVVLANTFVFAGNRSSAQVIISNLAILVALWIAYTLARGASNRRPS